MTIKHVHVNGAWIEGSKPTKGMGKIEDKVLQCSQTVKPLLPRFLESQQE